MSKTTTLAQMRALAQRASGAAAKVAQAAADAIEELARIKADRPGAADVTIPGEGWKEDGSGSAYPVYNDIPAATVTGKDRAAVVIAPESMEAAAGCGLCPTCESMAGSIRLRARQAPGTAITAQYWIDEGKE